MARTQSPANVYPRMHNPSPLKSLLRSKGHALTLLAGIFVLGCLFIYSRDGRGLPSATKASFKTEPFKLPPDVDPSIKKPSAAPVDVDVDDDDDLNSAPSPGSPGRLSSPSSSSSSSSSSSAGDYEPYGGHPAQPATTLSQASLGPDSPRAIIIESDMIPNLIPLMLHFATVLGPSWGIILFTLAKGWVEPLSPAFQRHLAAGRIEVRFLPPATELTSSQAVSRFLTAPWLWEQVENAPRVLLFQSDSVLCSRSQAAVEDYFAYDLVGAPILAVYGQGYNGGLSIRNPRTFLNVTREVDFAASGHEFEDQFFYQELKKMGAPMPAEAVAKTFAVETIYYETPLGYHQPHRWQAENMGDIEEWCPEVKMLIGRRAG
ncbi:unnamed protein product [Discula destructiva]